jgi:hypothetical protein
MPRREEGAQAHSIDVTLHPPLADSMRAAGEESGADLDDLARHAVLLLVSDLAAGAAPGSGTAQVAENDVSAAGG